ncbi:hypothetical protein ACFFX0_03370 [Citricoccus parietis]|uniref:Uncharacterized protein n=1 Tax=Citricoccus parietis TaxID=592307 RepID=A0ABV5FUC4_9MICC
MKRPTGSPGRTPPWYSNTCSNTKNEARAGPGHDRDPGQDRCTNPGLTWPHGCGTEAG